MSELTNGELLEILTGNLEGLSGSARSSMQLKIYKLQQAMVDISLGPALDEWPEAEEFMEMVEIASTAINNAEQRAGLLNDIIDRAFKILGVPVVD